MKTISRSKLHIRPPNLECGDFWGAAKDDFRTWKALLMEADLPTWADLDRHWASLASKGKISGNLKKKLKAQYLMWPGDEERQAVIGDALSVIRDTKILSAVERGLQNKTCDGGFFWSWTRYQRAAAVLLALELAGDSAQKDFHKKESQSSGIMQKYIYAHWMYERWAKPSLRGRPLKKDARGKAEQELAILIAEAIEKRDMSGFERACLKQMIKGEKDDVELQGRITKFSAEQLCTLVEHGKITPQDFPQINFM